MRKKEYVSMKFTIIFFREKDIIVTSGPSDTEGLFSDEGVDNDIFGD